MRTSDDFRVVRKLTPVIIERLLQSSLLAEVDSIISSVNLIDST